MLYGAYGANLNKQSMELRCPDAKPMISFHLKGYRLVFNSVADIVKDPKGTVPIVLWKITKKCEKALDRFEGYPFLYNKIRVQLDIPGIKGKKVMFYVMRRKGIAIPPSSYFKTIEEGYDDFGLDKTYLHSAKAKASQYQELNLNLARKITEEDDDDLELGVDWEYDWDGSHIPLTDKAKRRMNNG